MILPMEEARPWLEGAREALRGYPLTIPGPYGQPLAVGHQDGFAVLINPMAERPEDKQYVPIEVEIVPGVIIPLVDVRVAYPDAELTASRHPTKKGSPTTGGQASRGALVRGRTTLDVGCGSLTDMVLNGLAGGPKRGVGIRAILN
jgi:hypothetical protein